MIALQKSRFSFMAFFIFLPGSLFAALDNAKVQEISIHYLNQEMLNGVITVACSDQDGICQSTLEFEHSGLYQNNAAQYPITGMRFQGHFYKYKDKNQNHTNSSELGSITVQKDDKATNIPLSIDYEQLPPGDKDNSITRAIIAQLHPSLIGYAQKELEQISEFADYLTGETKNAETLHLFKPEPHKLLFNDSIILENTINDELLVLDIGDSYSMVLVFNHDNIPTSIYVLDRWKLYRDPIFKTIIGYGDLVGLVLHGMDFIKHCGSLTGLAEHSDHHAHNTTLANFVRSIGVGHTALHRLTSLIGAGFHIAEIVDHTHGVGDFISGSQKHFHHHHHGVWSAAFGIMHLGHTFFELAMMNSLAHGIQAVLTVASFAYHHVPHRYYEYSMSDILKAVTISESKNLPDVTSGP